MSTRGPRKPYALKGYSGLVQKQVARSTGREVGVYAAEQAGIEADPELPWVTVCEPHGSIVCHPTLALAKAHAVEPEAWCDDCREE